MNSTERLKTYEKNFLRFNFLFITFVQSAEQEIVDGLWGQNFKGWDGIYFDCFIDLDGPDLEDLCSILDTNFSYLASSLSIPHAVGTVKKLG